MLGRQISQLNDADEIEKLKLKLEYFKALTTLLSIIVTLIGVLGAFIFNSIIEERRSRVDFELKAMEIVMSASSPAAAVNKATVLREMFPERLSKDFPETIKSLYDASESLPSQ